MQTQLVQTITEDDLVLNGLYNSGDKQKPAVILIHGFTTDFYSHKFFHEIQKILQAENIANISIQTRGTGIHTEFLKRGLEDGVFIGSFYEKLSEAHLDISAWIEFLQSEGYSNIILAGHSLGTIKTVRYLFEGKYASLISKIILLAPFDKNGYFENLTPGKRDEFLEIANKMCLEGKGEETIPKNFDDYPMSYQTFVSWYENSELSNIWDFYKGGSYNNSLLKQISIPVKIIVGDKDADFYRPEFSTLESTMSILKNNINNLEIKLIEGSGHTYVGFEQEVAAEVEDFISNVVQI